MCGIHLVKQHVADSCTGRRRKIRCLYTRDDQNSCIACKKKDRQCQEQTRDHFPSANISRRNRSLKDRVTQLEALLKSTRLELKKDGSAEASDFLTPERSDRGLSHDVSADFRTQSIIESDEDEDEEYEHDPDPLVSLFNSKLVCQAILFGLTICCQY